MFRQTRTTQWIESLKKSHVFTKTYSAYFLSEIVEM